MVSRAQNSAREKLHPTLFHWQFRWGFVSLFVIGMFGSNILAQSDHPNIFLSSSSHGSFRSIDDFKHAKPGTRIYRFIERINEQAMEDLKLAFIDPSTPFSGRDSIHLRHQNVSYDMAIGVRDRLSRAAFLYLLTRDTAYKELIMNQIVALGDTTRWPLWCDHAHLSSKPYVDIRTFRISMWVAICYNWLHNDLSESERVFILDLLDRRAIQPFWQKLAQKPHWYVSRHNWFTNIFAGMGITAMALGKDHPQTTQLLDTIVPEMIRFNDIIGKRGEFNEPPGYAGAVRYSVEFAEAYRYYTGNNTNLLNQHPFPALCYWMMYHTIPPQRLIAFGDTPIDAHPRGSEVMAAVANASQNGVLQWYYHQNFPQISSIVEMLWYDPTLSDTTPNGKLPLGKVFEDYSASFISRTSWDQNSAESVVYGKAGREMNHDDNDVGQLLIDGFGKKLIIDCGKPDPIYPADYFKDTVQYNYYTRSTYGHNVLMIGNREMRSEPNATARGKTKHFWSDDDLGSSWSVDLTPVYPMAEKVERRVAHLFPGIVVVYDSAKLPQAKAVSMRWHTFSSPRIFDTSNFVTTNEDVQLIGKVISLSEQPVHLQAHKHRFEPPYHLSRQGDPLIQVNQSFVECRQITDHYTSLTLFAISKKAPESISWTKDIDGWKIDLPTGRYYVRLESNQLRVYSDEYRNRFIALPLQP